MQDMKYVEFDQTRPMDLILLGRVAIDFNPAYNDQVKEEFKPLKDVHTFEKFVGGSPANIAVGVTRHGLKAGFLGKVSDDQFGDYVTEYFDKQGIDTSHITRCTNGEKLGLTFTEMLSEKESHILMYRNCIADLQLHVDDIDEEYIRQSKAILISGTALAESPSREAAIKAVMLAKKNDTKVIFDVDYREYNWKNSDEISIYYSIVAKEADIIIVAAGRAGVVGADYVKPGQTIIDVGINVNAEGKLCGDVDYAAVEPIVDAITPVPGGVGSVTTSVLVGHVVEAAMRKYM